MADRTAAIDLVAPLGGGVEIQANNAWFADLRGPGTEWENSPLPAR